jgi:hypothetical protein
MFTDYFDIKRPKWDGETLAALQKRLEESGYQGLTGEFHALIRRYVNADVDRSPAAILTRADEYADVLIPPAHPHARIIVHRQSPEVLRIVVAGRSHHEARMVQTALKLHLETVLGRLSEGGGDDHGRSTLNRFRREVVPALRLQGNGERGPDGRFSLGPQLLRAMRRQPVVRGRPTVLVSQLATLAPDKPSEQVRDVLEHLVTQGALERWHVVICREGGQWLGSSPTAEEMRAFSALKMDCPHCGRRVSDEQSEVAYRLGEQAETRMNDNRWMCDIIETALRKLGVEAVAVQPGAGPVDGAACYQDAVILFRATDEPVEMGDVKRLQDQGRQLEGEGWRVFPLIVSDRPIGVDTKAAGVTVVESMNALDGVLDQILRTAREASLSAMLPTHLRLAAIALIDLLPSD